MLCAHVWDATRLSDLRLATEDPKERIPPVKSRRPERLLRDGEELQVGDMNFTIMHTPGHTPGSICLYESRAHLLFVGDVMTKHAISRTDFIGANARNLQESLARIADLPDETRIFPGHGSPTTLQDERWMLDLAKLSSA
jgi:hydroxyacylglutathione hydrolase